MKVDIRGEDSLVARPGEGGMQGDTIMASEFAENYNRRLEVHLEGKEIRGRLLKATDPWAGRAGTTDDKQQITMTSYADDVGETHVARKNESMLEIAVQESRSFADAIGEDGMSENKSKADHLIQTTGPGAVKRGKEQAANFEGQEMGMIVLTKKYLGNHLDYDSANSTFVRQRMLAISEAYASLYGLWRNVRVSFGRKRMAFQSIVYGTALSGLEPMSLNDNEIKRLDKEITKRARMVLGRLGVDKTAEGRWQVSNREVWRRMGIRPFTEEVRRRRWRRWQRMLLQSEGSAQVRAAVWGTIEVPGGEQWDQTIIHGSGRRRMI